MISDETRSSNELQWLGLGNKMESQTLRSALNFTQKALINSFKPMCIQIDYQSLTYKLQPALFMIKSNDTVRIWAPDLTI